MPTFPPHAAAKRLAAAAETEDVLRAAARVFRLHGLAAATLAQVAEELGVEIAALRADYATKDLLAQAVFAETLRILNAVNKAVWTGYGAGMRNSLAAARTFQDGYVVLVRDAPSHPAHQSSWMALRKRAAQRSRSLLWYPDRAPPPGERPALLDVALEPMVSFTITAIAHWIENGDPADDDIFLHWCAQMMRDWRHNTCELLNLDTPDQDWPFDTEAPPLPTRSQPR